MRKVLYIVSIILFSTVELNAKDRFYLIKNNIVSPVLYSGDSKVVNNAIDIFLSDSKDVAECGAERINIVKDRTVVIYNLAENNSTAIANVDISKINNQWEAFMITSISVDNKECLAVIGSDERGTVYGILELSKAMGISPWSWWADVEPHKKENLQIDLSIPIIEKPSVQYRGIFLNDEDWALMPWSSKTFEPESLKGEIGPRTYSKIFELLLRLKANTIWPAMHECTVPFYFKEGNREAAEKYGIVVGTSHCEPMMRCSASEWDYNRYGAYNYVTNREKVQQYWGERVSEITSGSSENVFTIGMRGVHDSRMQGVSTLDEETSLLQTIISDQRKLIEEYYNKLASSVPQIFVPYKEVLKAYNNGLKLPDDVTIMWCDDNQGYITRLSNEEEQKRSGGAGVYYHASYWGKPHDYLWLASTPPGLIYREMKRAWDYGARKIWILNVGDIKPAEYLTNFFLDLAWDINSIEPHTIKDHRDSWISSTFGAKHSEDIATIMDGYYTLASHRKPEHMGWNKVEANKEESRVHNSELNPFIFGDEIEQRLADYQKIANISSGIYESLQSNEKPAYFQLVHYPVLASAAMNKKMLYAQKARLFAKHKLPVANEYAAISKAAYGEIAALTYYYNKDMLKGKWDGMMDFKPRDLPVFQEPVLPQNIKGDDSNDVLVWVENDSLPLSNTTSLVLPNFTKPTPENYFISFFTKSGENLRWEVLNKPDYIDVVEHENGLTAELKLEFNYLPQKYQNANGVVDIMVNDKKYRVEANVNNVEQIDANIPLEQNNMVLINIQKPRNFEVVTIENLGHSTNAVLLNKGSKHSLSYEFQTHSSGKVAIRLGFIPQYAANKGELRYAVSIDNEKPQIIRIDSEFLSKKWSVNTLRNQTITLSEHNIKKSGKHTVKITSLDEDIAIDQLMIDFDLDRKFYLFPNNGDSH